MTTVHDFTAQHLARKALFEAAKVAFADDMAVASPAGVDVVFGFRWPMRHRDWVAVTDTDSQIDPATIGARRGQDEVITLTLSIGSWRPYYPSEPDRAELDAADRAFDLLQRLQRHVAVNDVTLGDTVSWCLPGSAYAAGATSEEDAVQGRITEIAATFVCQHHIRRTPQEAS